MNILSNAIVENVTHYRLSDDRVWSIEQAKFVDDVPEWAVFCPCRDVEGKTPLESLLHVLEFYGYDKGEYKSDAELADETRAKRNALIAETDYLAMPDYPLTEETRVAVLAYRQALRDVPEQAGFPRNIEWPVNPLAN